MINGAPNASVGWHVEGAAVPYPVAVAAMEARAAAIRDSRATELVWLLEHPPLYTAGTSARDKDLVTPGRLPVHRTGRGGQYTYHGPGQRVAYVMLDVGERFGDIRAFVSALEDWLIAALDEFNIRGERRKGRVGIWVARPEKGPMRDEKIAALGIRIRRWVSYHGIALNVEPDLDHFSGIVPCGISDQGVTSLADLGLPVAMSDADIVLKRAFEHVFGSEVVATSSPIAAHLAAESAS